MKLMNLISLAILSAWSLQVLAAPAAGPAPCTPLDLGFDSKTVNWVHVPMSKLKKDTVYKKSKEDGRTVLSATANGSASLYTALIKPAITAPATVSWDWKTQALVPGADNRDKSREDAPLRVLFAFDGNKAALPSDEQTRFNRAKKLSGRELPYAVLMYIWSDLVAVDTVIPSAHTSQIKMIAVTSGASGLGAWQTVRRDLVADYRRAFGADPGPLLGVAAMTDADNTGAKAVGQYADLKLQCAGG